MATAVTTIDEMGLPNGSSVNFEAQTVKTITKAQIIAALGYTPSQNAPLTWGELRAFKDGTWGGLLK